MSDRLTQNERRQIERELAKLKGWNQHGKNDAVIKFREARLARDTDAQARDEKRGRHRRER